MRFDADVVLARTEGGALWPRRARAERDTPRASDTGPVQIVERAREQADGWNDLLDLSRVGPRRILPKFLRRPHPAIASTIPLSAGFRG